MKTEHEPFHSDITYYAVAGHEWLQGKPLYSDVIDHKPPAIYLSYAAAEAIFGYGDRAVLFLNVFCALMTLVAVFFGAYGVTHRALGGLVAAAVWTFVGSDLPLEANQPNAEAFLNVFFAAAFAAAWRFEGRELPKGILLAAGFGLAVSTWYWQPAFVVCAAWILVWGIQGRSYWKQSATLVAGLIAWWGAAWIYFLAVHRALDFRRWLFDFNRFYAVHSEPFARHLWHSFYPDIVPTDLHVTVVALFFPLLGVSVLAMAIAVSRRYFWRAAVLAGYFVSVHLAIAITGNFFSHYYQLWIPGLCIGCGWLIGLLLESSGKGFRVFGAVLAFAIPLYTAAVELPYWRLSSDEWSTHKYGPEFLVTKQLAGALPDLLGADDTFYEWGMQTGLYYWSRRRPITGAFYSYFLQTGPEARVLTARVLGELYLQRPELCITILWPWAGAQTYLQHPIHFYILNHYRRFEWNGHRGSFQFYALRGGRLEKRIESGLLPCRFLNSDAS